MTGEGFEVLLSAGGAGAPIDVVALAAWSLTFPGLEPRFSVATRQQLERSAAQYDRLVGTPGTSAKWIVERMQRVAGDHAQGLDPRTLAFYVADLKATARELRRRRRGKGPPRPHRPRGRA